MGISMTRLLQHDFGHLETCSFVRGIFGWIWHSDVGPKWPKRTIWSPLEKLDRVVRMGGYRFEFRLL